jgi:acetoin utilization deacetylase AcuC-like enzyme
VRVVYSDEHRSLDPVYEVEHGVASPPSDVPLPGDVIVESLQRRPWVEIVGSTEHGREPILALHDADLLAFLETAWSAWTAEGETRPLYPDTSMHASLRDHLPACPEPSTIGARMGYWCFETFTPIVERTYRAARAAVDVALTAADHVLGGDEIAYGLCRPPGHHVGARIFGGSSYLNNAAIAAEYIRHTPQEPVAILDVDLHHGNGTQQLFYERDDVLHVSLHGDPRIEYTYFTGFANERGRGPGEGFNLNIPLAKRCGSDIYLRALEQALETISMFPSSIVVVSLGVDTFRLDGRGLDLTTEDYGTIGTMIGKLGRELVVIQEGGYYLPDLGENVARWLRGANGIEEAA